MHSRARTSRSMRVRTSKYRRPSSKVFDKPFALTTTSSFIAQRLRRLHPRSAPGGIQRREETERERKQTDADDISELQLRRQVGDVVDIGRKKLMVGQLLQ